MKKPNKMGKGIALAIICLAVTGGAVAGGIAISKNIDLGDIQLPWENSSSAQKEDDSSLTKITPERKYYTF